MSDMSENGFTPIPEEAETTAENYIDPTGPAPEGIPDPMPDDLEFSAEADKAFEDADAMDDEAPTG